MRKKLRQKQQIVFVFHTNPLPMIREKITQLRNKSSYAQNAKMHMRRCTDKLI